MPQGENLGLGLVLHQGQHVDGEGGLELGLGEEAVQDHLGIGVPLELNDDAHAVAIGLVPDIADALQPLVLHLLSHVLDEHALVDLVGDLGDDDAGTAVAEFLKLMPGPDHQTATAGGIGGADAAAAHDDAAGGEVRSLDVLHQVAELGLRIIQHADAGADDLPQVVGRDVGSHAHGDAGGAVDQQVGEPGGEDPGLFPGLVEVGVPVHGLLVDIPQHLVGDAGHAGLRVPVGRRGIAVDGAEVAVAVHQRVAHGEVLGKAHQGVIDGGVSVGMVPAQHVAHGGGALAEGVVVGQVILVHGVEDPAVHRFEAVPHIRQGTAHDNAHGVFDVGFLHLGDQRRLHDLLIGIPDLLGIVLGFFRHRSVSFLSSPGSRRTWRSFR